MLPHPAAWDLGSEIVVYSPVSSTRCCILLAVLSGSEINDSAAVAVGTAASGFRLLRTDVALD